MGRKLSLYWRMIIVVASFTISFNIAARFEGFCDWYVENIFPIWVNTYGRFSGLFPFSLGECLIAIAIILVLIALACGILFIFLRKNETYKTFVIRYYKCCLGIGVVVALLYALNCNVLYNCSVIDANPNIEEREYTNQELEIIRNYFVEQINHLSEQVERNEEGEAIYSGDLNEEAKQALRKFSQKYNRLAGYYPNAKPIMGSRFMSLTEMAGVYFPFSMEANYNSEMYSTMYPGVLCHEYAHLKGYIYEDEANFIGYMACIESDDVFFQYCGYIGAYDYVDSAYMENVSDERYMQQISLNDKAWLDDSCWLEEEAEEQVYYPEEESVLNVETLSEISEIATDTSLKFYGIEDGFASYDRVTELLLQYYDGKLY